MFFSARCKCSELHGFRGYFEKKPHFIQSVPFAIQNLRDLLKEAYPEYPYLCNVLRELTELKQFTDDLKKRQLTVKVMSFAYKKGIPDDPTGNGGGYVFDCRAVNNPGKYERYKPFTGLDEPVISFLEEDGEILRFLDSVYALVDASVKCDIWNVASVICPFASAVPEDNIVRFIRRSIWQST